MAGCHEIRELFSLHLDGELEAQQRAVVAEHIDGCDECRELLETMEEIVGASSMMDDLDPPDGLDEDLSSSPCRLWLGLLFQAVDREISQHNLERLLTHLEGCPGCRTAWQDLTLIHQVGDAMQPPDRLLQRCIKAREKKVAAHPLLNRRLATVAAYFLAVFTSLVVGNPVSLARSEAGSAVGRVAERVSEEVTGVAEQGRGEVRVMMWRAWKWGERRVEAVRDFINKDDEINESGVESPATSQGESS